MRYHQNHDHHDCRYGQRTLLVRLVLIFMRIITKRHGHYHAIILHPWMTIFNGRRRRNRLSSVLHSSLPFYLVCASLAEYNIPLFSRLSSSSCLYRMFLTWFNETQWAHHPASSSKHCDLQLGPKEVLGFFGGVELRTKTQYDAHPLSDSVSLH